MKRIYSLLSLLCVSTLIFAQKKYDPKETEYYSPVPPIVTPGASAAQPPSDAIILLGNSGLLEWELDKENGGVCDWLFENGVMTVNKKSGDIRTKKNIYRFSITS